MHRFVKGRKHLASLSMMILTTACLQGLASTSAVLADSSPFTVLEAQRPLEQLAHVVHDLARTAGVEGFGGTEFATTQRTLIVYWHGSVPAVVRDALNHKPAGYQFAIRQAGYSLAQLNQEIKRLLGAPQSSLAAKIVRIGPLNDYSGIVVGVDVGAVAAGAALPTVTSSIPITVIQVPSGTPLGRQNDSPAFWGGARLNLNGSGWCTTGFVFRNVFTGVQGITTADHCYENTTFTTGNNGYTVGTSGSCCHSVDTTVITGKSYGPITYTGAWNSGTAATVTGFGYASVNQYVCAGGSYSGEQCLARITAVNQTYNGLGPGYFAQKDNGYPLAGHGDSGGPSYSYAGSGVVTAYGMVDQGEYAANFCAGVATGTCYYAVFFVNVTDAAYQLSSGIVTG
jgi:hypothetical protein